MESNTWNQLSAPSMRHQSTLQSRFDISFDEFEEVEGEMSLEFACPFCDEDYDIVELCYHIDEEHPDEASYGICPVCAAGVGTDMVTHMTTEHANIFKMQSKMRLSRGSSESYSTLSLLRKELGEGNLQSLIDGLEFKITPSNSSPDPLLSSFITNLPFAEPQKDKKPLSEEDGKVPTEASEEKTNESIIPTAISSKEQEEMARKSEFVQGLMLSTIFDDIL